MPASGVERVIHQVWYDMGNGATPPAQYVEWQNQLLKANPKWKLMQWGRQESDDLIHRHFPWFAATFADYADDIFRIDAIRFLALYIYGGIYIDMDVQMIENLDKIVDSHPGDAILARSPLWNRSVSNYFMAAPSFHPLMRLAIERMATRGTCTPLNARDTFLGTMMIAGPQFLSDVYNDYLVACEDESVDPRVWLPSPYAFTPTPPTGVWHLGHHNFHSSWGSGSKARGDIARLLALIGIFVAIVVVYKTGGLTAAISIIALLGGAVVLWLDSTLQSCRSTPRRIVSGALNELEESPK
jgi:hypothetical protein